MPNLFLHESSKPRDFARNGLKCNRKKLEYQENGERFISLIFIKLFKENKMLQKTAFNLMVDF